MKAEAVPLGEKLLEQEATLDHPFASHSITTDNLKTITAKISVTSARHAPKILPPDRTDPDARTDAALLSVTLLWIEHNQTAASQHAINIDRPPCTVRSQRYGAKPRNKWR
jgi:hypothetical protein